MTYPVISSDESDPLCELEELVQEAVQYSLLPTRIEKLVMLNHLTKIQDWIQKMKNEGL